MDDIPKKRVTKPCGRTALVRRVGQGLLITSLLMALTGCACGPALPKFQLSEMEPVDSPHFQSLVGAVLSAPFTAGNLIEPFHNGNEFFPAMLGAIRSAQRTVTFESFIFHTDAMSNAFADAFIERARAGVKCHVILDALGGPKEDKIVRRMRAAGVEVHIYNPLRWYRPDLLRRYNYRTHRKLLIIDGRVGFTGGAAIDDAWDGDGRTPDQWRDSMYRVTGPVVAQMQGAFLNNWMRGQGEILHGEEYFPELKIAGNSRALVFVSDSFGPGQEVVLHYLLSFEAARESILLETAYLLLDDTLEQALIAARERGVRVQVVVPGENIDSLLARACSRRGYGDLLEVGVEIFEYQPALFHSKLMIVDGQWVSIGSSNMDHRSFRLNDEANMIVHDARLGAELTDVFEQDRELSRSITYEMWKDRSWLERVMGLTASLFGPQM